MLLNQRSALAGDLNNTVNQIKEVQARLSELEKQLSSVPKTTMTAAASSERQMRIPSCSASSFRKRNS